MIRFFICDDDKMVTDLISKIVKQQYTDSVLCVFNDPLQAKFSLLTNHYDVYLLDIVMPDITGIELAKEIRKVDNKGFIIFLTSSDEFRADAYAVEALQYLEKPVLEENLIHSLDRAILYKKGTETKKLAIQTKNGLRPVSSDDIIYVESHRHVLILHLQNGVIYESVSGSLTLEKLAEELSFPPFCSPCRGFIVNFNYVECLDKCTLSMTLGSLVPISTAQSASVRKQYSDYLLNSDVRRKM